MAERGLGERLLVERTRLVLTQEELAVELGIPYRSLQDYETGKATPRAPRRRAILAWLEEHERTAAAA